MANINRIVDVIFQEKVIFESVFKNWQKEVALWNGLESDLGVSNKIEYTTPLPNLINVRVPTAGDYEVLGRIDCNALAGTNATKGANQNVDSASCVEIKLTSVFEYEFNSSMLPDVFNLKSIPPTVPGNYSIGVENNYYLVSDPNTLLPYSIYELTQSVIRRKDSPDDKKYTLIDEVNVQYSY